jgi:nucleotide-binding universal stress UspA family protein
VKRFSNILLIVDEGPDHSAALKRAVALAKNNQAHLTVCTVVDAVPDDLQMAITAITPAELQQIAVTEKRDRLDQVVNSVTTDGLSLDKKVLIGNSSIEIIRQVLRNDHDLIMKCVEASGGLENTYFGSTDMHLMRKCPCPVWVIKPTENHKYGRILAAVDKDIEEPVTDVLNRQILEMTSSLAIAESSEMHIVHAWNLVAEDFFRSSRSGISEAEVDAMVAEEATVRRRWLENLVNACGSRTTRGADDILEPHLHLIKGRARYVVPEIARELAVDLVVMGTVSRTGIAGFFIGNTAESILTQLDCSVLTVKPPGFISPVMLET